MDHPVYSFNKNTSGPKRLNPILVPSFIFIFSRDLIFHGLEEEEKVGLIRWRGWLNPKVGKLQFTYVDFNLRSIIEEMKYFIFAINFLLMYKNRFQLGEHEFNVKI